MSFYGCPLILQTIDLFFGLLVESHTERLIFNHIPVVSVGLKISVLVLHSLFQIFDLPTDLLQNLFQLFPVKKMCVEHDIKMYISIGRKPGIYMFLLLFQLFLHDDRDREACI